MEILTLANCNDIIGAPSDMQDGSCSALPVEKYTDDQGGMWCASFWKPSEEEVAVLVNGGVIALHVRAAGRQHPVVAIATTALV